MSVEETVGNNLTAGAEYSDFARLYDLYYPAAHDLQFYVKLVQEAGKNSRGLELACGSGRLAIPLLEACPDLHLTGLDLTETMLETARERLTPQTRMRSQFVQGDMRELTAALGSISYDLIVIAFNSFLHLLTPEDQLACLRQAGQYLAPNGRFVIDVNNPASPLHSNYNGQLVYVATATNPTRQSRLKLFFSCQARPEQQLWQHRYTCYETLADETIETTVATFWQRYQYQAQLQALAEKAGLVVEQFYGSHDYEPWSQTSPRLIMVCRRGED